MKAVKLASTKKMTRDEWLAIRKTGITGSRISGIMNVSPFETPRSVYCDLHGLRAEKEQTEPMYWGNALEDIIAKEFSKRTGFKVSRVNYVLQHPTYDFLLGNIDRLVIEDKKKGVLEVKNVSAYGMDEWKDGAPQHYQMQLQFYLALTGLQFGYLVALVGGQKLVSHRYERDDLLIDEMIDAATEFWFDHVLPMVEPPVTDRDTELLNQMFAQSEPDKILNLNGAIDSARIELLREFRQKYEEAETQYDLGINMLKDLMRECEVMIVNGEKVATWKTNKNGKRTFRLL